MVALHSEGKLVSPIDSAKKLLRLLISELYKSGQHVDFYDSINGIDINTVGVTTCCACPFCTCGEDCQCKSRGEPSCDPCVADISLKKARINRNDAVGNCTPSSSCCSGGDSKETHDKMISQPCSQVT